MLPRSLIPQCFGGVVQPLSAPADSTKTGPRAGTPGPGPGLTHAAEVGRTATGED
jgi:hypothetical protein